MWKLTIEDDEGTKIPLPLFRDEYTIGRSEENTIRLTERNISRRHGSLRRKDSDWVLCDLSSYNGLYINGMRVASEAQLTHGDVIQLGDYRIEVVDESLVENTPTSTPELGSATSKPDRLVVVAGPLPGQEFTFQAPTIRIGRAAEVDVSIPHISVSRVHAEIHSLGAGRYEIIDKGSANGVRVNGSLLGRALIEAGDYIELGEVRMKFVGAGQVFWPGAEATRLIPDATDGQTIRPPPPPPGLMSPSTPSEEAGPVRSNTMKNVAIGGIGAVVAVVAMLSWQKCRAPARQSVAATSGTVPTLALDLARAPLDQAKQLAAAGDLDGAHAKLAAGVPSGSALRDSPELREIENRWADALAAKADQEGDLEARRTLLNAIAQSTAVDPARRRTAVDKLRELDNRGTDISALPQAANHLAPTNPGPAPGPAAQGPRTTRGAVLAADPWAAPSPSPAPAPVARVEPDPPAKTGGNAADLAAQGREGELKARAQLEPKVWGGRASLEEIRLLRAICRHMGDRACSDRAGALLNAAQK
jgi:pSer/pThr/pTyr-binding forkhead associated (FHA) protein